MKLIITRKESELNIPNNTTATTIIEGRKIAYDDNVKSYSNISELKRALGV